MAERDEAVLDRPRGVREGEGLDVAAVDGWLRGQVEGLPDGPPEVGQFSGGASNLTYRLRYPDRDLILRRPPFGRKAKGAHDMVREYRLQEALAPVLDTVPTMVALCEDQEVLGCDFYVMERIVGIIPRADLPKGVELGEDGNRQLCTNVLDQLIALHGIDVESTGLSSFGKGRGYVQRQIEGWTRRYDKARTWNVPRWTPVIAWLREHMPDDIDTVLIHNDFRFDNVVLDPDDPTRVVGLLDWEMATLGDPLMDLGNTLAYWVQADDDPLMQRIRRQPTHLPGMLTRDEVVAYYLERTGYEVDDFTFYEVYGLFRLAVIVQQIYWRYHHKQTRNPAFRLFWVFNHYLRYRAGRALRARG